MKELYKLSTLGLGTLITVAVSLACSYWFFYSLMGGDGYQAIGAGVAGCAIQLFGYGFAATFLPINQVIRVGLCIVPLGISMLSTYSALYGYLSHEKASNVVNNRKQELIFNILEQSSKDKKIASDAADQGLGQAYRSQAKKFLEFNNQSRDKDEQLLGKLDEQQKMKRPASPLDGLVRVTGNNEMTTTIFCVWLAVLFDMLPVIAIGVYSSKKEEIQYSVMHHSKPDSAPQVKPVKKEDPVEQVAKKTVKDKPESSPQSDVSTKYKISQWDDVEESEDAIKGFVKKPNDLDFQIIINDINNGVIEPTYKEVIKRSGWNKYQVNKFFISCMGQGILQKEGRKYVRVENIAYLKPKTAIARL